MVRAQGGPLRDMMKPVTMIDAQGRAVKNHPVKIRAKTGTLNFVSGLAGYVKLPDGQDMAFAIFAADEKTRSGIPRELRDGPPGAKSWARRARSLQKKLIRRWASVYSG